MTKSLTDLTREIEARGCAVRGYVYRTTPVAGDAPRQVNTELVQPFPTVEEAVAWVIEQASERADEFTAQSVTLVVVPRIEAAL